MNRLNENQHNGFESDSEISIKLQIKKFDQIQLLIQISN